MDHAHPFPLDGELIDKHRREIDDQEWENDNHDSSPGAEDEPSELESDDDRIDYLTTMDWVPDPNSTGE